MIIMGLDPGSSGGISILETKTNNLPIIRFLHKMPTASMFGKKIVDRKRLSRRSINYFIYWYWIFI